MNVALANYLSNSGTWYFIYLSRYRDQGTWFLWSSIQAPATTGLATQI